MNPCDFSVGKPQAAEVYLNHEESLSKCSSKNAQKDLALVSPNTGGYSEERRCTEHRELLDCYCQDDLACVCVMCSIVGSHKGHSIVTLKEENDKQRLFAMVTKGNFHIKGNRPLNTIARNQHQAILSQTMKSIQENESTMTKALVHLQKSEDQIKNNKKTLTVQLSKLFQEIKSQVDQKEKQILGDIHSNEEKQLADVFALQKKVEGKRDVALHSLQELQVLSKQKDVSHFLKDFQLAQERIKKQNSSSGESVEVLTVHLDQSVIQDVRSHTEAYISSLDNLMQVVHDVAGEVFPSPPPPQTRKISGLNSAAVHSMVDNKDQDL